MFLFAKQTNPDQTGGQWYSDTSPFSIRWFVPGRLLQPSLMFVGKAGAYSIVEQPYSQSLD